MRKCVCVPCHLKSVSGRGENPRVSAAHLSKLSGQRRADTNMRMGEGERRREKEEREEKGGKKKRVLEGP